MRRSDAALFLARASAWGLLIGGWLVLGGLGHRLASAGALALSPLALWLAATAAGHALLRRRLPGSAATALALAALLGALAFGLRGLPAGPAAVFALHALALAWGLALALATQLARGLRAAGTTTGSGAPLPRPSARGVLAAASLGCAAAWAVAGDPSAVAASPATPGAALAVLAGLSVAAWALARPSTNRLPGRACRRAGVDCALAWPARAQWRDPVSWPALAAALVMLPMRSALPALADLCARSGFSPAAGAAAHLAAMLLPAWVVVALPQRALPALRPALVLLLAAGAGAALLAPGASGLMAAMGLQSMAWSAAWAAGTLRPAADARLAAPAAGPVASLAASVAALLALALASGWAGPSGLTPWVAAHAALGLLALAGAAIGAVSGVSRPRAPAPAASTAAQA